MIVHGIDYPVIGIAKITGTNLEFPVLDIPMMTDEEWRKITATPEQNKLRKMLFARKVGEYHG